MSHMDNKSEVNDFCKDSENEAEATQFSQESRRGDFNMVERLLLFISYLLQP